MTRYAAAGSGTGSDANEALANLWNPSSTLSLYVVRTDAMSAATTGGFFNHYLARTTTAGTTPGVTVTPDADSAFDRRATPPSGAVLYMGNFATTPTASSKIIRRWTPEHRAGELTSFMFAGRGIRIPPGQGLGWFLVGQASSTGQRQFGYTWDE